MSSKEKAKGDLSNLQTIAEGIAALDEEIKRLKKKKEELEEEFRPAVAGRGPVVFGNWIFECKLSEGRKTLDKQKMMDDGIDVAQYERTGKPFTTMTIKKVEQA